MGYKNENCCSDHNLQKPGPWLILALQGTKRSDITQFERNRRGRICFDNFTYDTFLAVMDLPVNLATLIISPKMDIQTSVKA